MRWRDIRKASVRQRLLDAHSVGIDRDRNRLQPAAHDYAVRDRISRIFDQATLSRTGEEPAHGGECCPRGTGNDNLMRLAQDAAGELQVLRQCDAESRITTDMQALAGEVQRHVAAAGAQKPCPRDGRENVERR